MARQREFEGRNVAEAVDKASQALEIDVKKIKYEVVSYGSTGIFGLVGARKAKITVKVYDKTSKMELVAPPQEAETNADPKVEPAAVVDEGQDAADPLASAGPADEETPQTASKGRDLSAAQARAEAYLQTIAEAISENPTLVSRLNGDGIEIDINSDNPAVLIGKRGQTHMAMQYLVERALNHRCAIADERIQVHLDVAGYQASRRENLIKLSHRLAEKAQRSGKPVTIGQLNPAERRIVHLALNGKHTVRTHSTGGGYVRKLTIFPSSKRREPPNGGQPAHSD